MRACRQCGLSMGDTATFCTVCGTVARPWEASPTTAAPPASVESEQAVVVSPQEVRSPRAEPSRGVGAAARHESEARRCEKTDAPHAIALYRQTILELLESSEIPLDSQDVRSDLQRAFDRLSLVLRSDGRMDEALEEIESATYLGLVDDEDCGIRWHREALVRRRDGLRRAAAKAALDGH